MNAGQINKMLYHLFCNYDYRLHNSFIYNWESDFFAVSGSGYCVEVEVKISRGDYFRDFEKEKHKMFQAFIDKKPFYINHGDTKGDRILRVRTGKLRGVDDYADQHRWRWRTRHNGKMGFWVNDNTRAFIEWDYEDLYAPASWVQFHEVGKKKCPNQLYFACPEGLIKPDEIPPYAGLIYCKDDAVYVKRAPYLHKNKQNMTGELLSKFYNLWQYKTTIEQKMELSRQIDIFHQSLLGQKITYEP